jgi:hypothetical protein
MTHRVVISDVECARRLIEAGCEESGVIATLCWRGVEEADAAGLVAALLRGEQVRLAPVVAHPSDAPKTQVSAEAPGDTFRPPHPQRKKRWHRGQSEKDGLGWKACLGALLLFCAIEYFVYWCMINASANGGREHEDRSFVQDDRFGKDGRSLTNTFGP